MVLAIENRINGDRTIKSDNNGKMISVNIVTQKRTHKNNVKK